MAYFLDTTGRSTLGIGLCARCSRKFSLEDLYDDPNFPGLKVCLADLDVLDPYRLPPREPDQINLLFVRPDDPLTIPASDTFFILLEDGSRILLESGSDILTQGAP